MPGAARAGIKKPAAAGAAGSVVLESMRFREGNEACVHLVCRPGGGPFCIAVFRVDSAHSFCRHRLLGAKPNHGFFHCQQPPARFLRAARCRRGAREPQPGATETRRKPRPHPRRRNHKRKTPCFLHSAKQMRRRARIDAIVGDNRCVPPRPCRRRVSAAEVFFPDRSVFRVAQAELRKNARPIRRLQPGAPTRRRPDERHALPSGNRIAPKKKPAAMGDRLACATRGRGRQCSSSSSSSA